MRAMMSHSLRGNNRHYAKVGAGFLLNVPPPVNEPILGYRKGSKEREEILAAIEHIKSNPVDVPVVINGEEIRSGDTKPIRSPHDHSVKLGVFHSATEEDIDRAIEGALEAKKKWMGLPPNERIAVFLKAAELLRGPYRAIINAATVVGQSKNFFQAEIDAAVELIDFWQFNALFAQQIYEDQPVSDNTNWNRVEYRPLEGFVYAVTPFNFSSIAANLCSAPALMGNVALWKPSSTAMLSAHYMMELMREAGLPDGVINFIPGDPSMISNKIVHHPEFSGLHFTGSTQVFNKLWRDVGNRIDTYKTYPRIVGETGGKDFIFAHNSADPDALSTALVRGAFEFQGQKCSACSRAFIPASLWEQVKEKVTSQVQEMKVGNPELPETAVGAVIDERSFKNASSYIQHAREQSNTHEIVVGGEVDDSKGWFIHPTVVHTTDPKSKLLMEEIFAPILTIWVYEDEDFDKTLTMCDAHEYALTGAIFAQDRNAIHKMTNRLSYAAGNFYINDKPTGAVVGQQPFGGMRASGTNDKAGSKMNLLRWVSARTIKETFNPPKHFAYPYMKE